MYRRLDGILFRFSIVTMSRVRYFDPINNPIHSCFKKSLTMKIASPEEADAVTGVFWNMNECPVPRGVDARMVDPCIKRFVESFGYNGPLTTTAIGVLTNFPDNILRGLYSSGINLSHVPAGHLVMRKHISLFTQMYPPHANIISISEPDSRLSSLFGRMMGYNFLQPFSSYYGSFLKWLLEAASDSVAPEEETETENVDSAYWECFVCNRDPPAKGFESLKTHLSGEEHQELLLRWLPTTERFYASPSPPSSDSQLKEFSLMSVPPTEPTEIDHQAVTCVFWDIKMCPVPPGSDARLVGPAIKRYLANLGYSGPVTITAVGVLTDVPIDTLRGLCSSGIALTNVPYGSRDILVLMSVFTKDNPPPANFVIISHPDSGLSDFRPLPRYGQFLLPSLPVDVGELDDDKCSETGECSCHVCLAGNPGHSFQSFEDFATHLSSRAHQRKMLDWVPRNVRVSGLLRT